MSAPARLGGLQLLVYLECPCGRWCANPEGGSFPRCDSCGGFYVPGGGPMHDGRGPRFSTAAAVGTPFDSRRLRCLGFAAFLTSEGGAMRLVNRLRSFVGLNGPDGDFPIDGPDRPAGAGRLYTESEVRERSDEVAADIASGSRPSV